MNNFLSHQHSAYYRISISNPLLISLLFIVLKYFGELFLIILNEPLTQIAELLLRSSAIEVIVCLIIYSDQKQCDQKVNFF